VGAIETAKPEPKRLVIDISSEEGRSIKSNSNSYRSRDIPRPDTKNIKPPNIRTLTIDSDNESEKKRKHASSF